MTVAGYHHVEHVMGMAISIDVHDHVSGTPGLSAVVAWFHHIDRTFSTYATTARSPASAAVSSDSAT